jgi:hypothetical protein
MSTETARQTSQRLTPRALITTDWIAGATAGGLMLALHPWLSRWYALPQTLLLFIAAANLGYAMVSFTIARRARGAHVPGLRLMAAANVAWGVVCVALGIRWFDSASVWGLAQLFGEAVLVGGLGVVEWVVSRQAET